VTASSGTAPAGIMMLDDDLLKRVSKKGEIYVVTLKKQAAKKCTMTVLATIVGARKGDLEVTCSMELKPGDYVVAIETTGPTGKQITSAASVVPGLADAAAKAHTDKIKTLK
jgi:hypothetical protein